MRRLQCRVQVGIGWTHERAFHADIRLESKELTKFAERERFRCLCPLALSANTAKRRARDVHVEEGDVPRLETTIGGGVDALRHFLRGNQQPDPVIGVHRPVVRRCREAKHRPCHLVDVGRALRDGCVGTVDTSGPTGTRLEALTQSKLEVGVSDAGAIAIAERRIDLRVGLRSHGRAEQPTAGLL